MRTTTTWARLVMAWFLLTLGAAGAGPFVSPHSVQWLCSVQEGMQLVLLDAQGQQVQDKQHTLDCSLCLSPLLPVESAAVQQACPMALAPALDSIAAAHIAARVGAPLPPRGPPGAA